MKKYLVLGLVIAVAAIIAAALRFSPTGSSAGATASTSVQPVRQVTLNGKPLELKTVSAPADVQEGLGDRASMPAGHGMLFDFRQPAIYAFWMRHMHFPLDIIWLKDGRVVDIAADLPPPKNSLDIPVTHTPTVQADQVLELNAGEAQVYGLAVGSAAVFAD